MRSKRHKGGAEGARSLRAKRAVRQERRSFEAETHLLRQRLLARLAAVCLRGPSRDDILGEAARMATDGLDVPFSCVAEYLPEQGRLLIRAGVGLGANVIGVEELDPATVTAAGFALRAEQAVICNNLEDDSVFRVPPLLRARDIRRAVTVALKGDGAPFGILEACSDHEGEFSADDLPFIESAAAIAGLGLERQRTDQDLRSALEWERVLVDEMNHRIRNSLQFAATSLLLDAGTSDVPEVRDRLQQASCQVSAIARVHDQLSMRRNPTLELELSAYLLALRETLVASGFPCDADVGTVTGLRMTADMVMPLGILLTELVTNAFKHGPRHGLAVVIRVERSDGEFVASVIDNGPGLPPEFDVTKSPRLGFRIIQHVVRRTGGRLEVMSRPGLTEIRLHVPLLQLTPPVPGGHHDPPPRSRSERPPHPGRGRRVRRRPHVGG